MKATFYRVAVAALCLTHAMPAMADVRVSYTVDHAALKTAVSGTALTFTLFSDNACMMQLGSPVTTAIDDVALIERLKRFVPKQGTKVPATDRLTHVLLGVTAPSTAFLTVTGTGITAVGGSCQLQFSSSQGANLPCASQVGDDVYFDGCNVNIRNGSGSTDGPMNGLGNLIVGYNANTGGHGRNGSHNLVVGDEHTYSSYGSLVAGFMNSVVAPGASVSGGGGNTASAAFASVSGGLDNTASASFASVSGGQCNLAGPGTTPSCTPSFYATSSVSGGLNNVASGLTSSVSGGTRNLASGRFASVSGGTFNVAGPGTPPPASASPGDGASVSGGAMNSATGTFASVSGGECNIAGPNLGPSCGSQPGGSSVSGGLQNVASGDQTSVTGGYSNMASGSVASVSGGEQNAASGQGASVSGGMNNTAGGGQASVSGGLGLVAPGSGQWHAPQSPGFPTGTEY